MGRTNKIPWVAGRSNRVRMGESHASQQDNLQGAAATTICVQIEVAAATEGSILGGLRSWLRRFFRSVPHVEKVALGSLVRLSLDQ